VRRYFRGWDWFSYVVFVGVLANVVLRLLVSVLLAARRGKEG
jgi:hypothetical protein